ncbi:hypothetical protein IJ670_06915 [bacterium]|nr:hypothetical protein [bacterium]
MTALLDNAKTYFYNKDYKPALKIFVKEQDFYSAGLCCLLLNHQKRAKTFWQYSKHNSPASMWGLCVLDLINLKVPNALPGFFQTRAQLEIYLSLFLENNKIEWAQNLISSSDFLFKANPESYKFIARALYANGYFEFAVVFCNKSLEIFWSDPEALLIMAQCYYLLGDKNKAKHTLVHTLNVAEKYYPALLFKKILQEND